MKFFKVYTEHNCLLECMLEKATQKCGCVSWEFPYKDSNKLPFCIGKGQICHKFFIKINSKSVEAKKECGCLPDCSYIKYDYSLSQPPIDQRKLSYLCTFTSGADNTFYKTLSGIDSIKYRFLDIIKIFVATKISKAAKNAALNFLLFVRKKDQI